jgi:hypothetical protein
VHCSVKIQDLIRAPMWGVTTASVWIPRRCDILTATPTGPTPPEQDPMPLVTDTSAACLFVCTCCLPHVSTLFSDFPQIGDRVSINILVTESASLSLASNRPNSQPYDPIVLTARVGWNEQRLCWTDCTVGSLVDCAS